jgi:hypothetical protein
MINLLNAVDVDTDGSLVTASVYPKIIAVWADDFGGGTVNIETSPDSGTTWIPITRGGVALTYTANSVDQISGLIAQGFPIRATLTGSTSPSNVSAALYEFIG